jgi:hypothetical protein
MLPSTWRGREAVAEDVRAGVAFGMSVVPAVAGEEAGGVDAEAFGPEAAGAGPVAAHAVRVSSIASDPTMRVFESTGMVL